MGVLIQLFLGYPVSLLELLLFLKYSENCHPPGFLTLSKMTSKSRLSQMLRCVMIPGQNITENKTNWLNLTSKSPLQGKELFFLAGTWPDPSFSDWVC